MFSNAAGTTGLIADIQRTFAGAVPVLKETPYAHDPRNPDRVVYSFDVAETIRQSPPGLFVSEKNLIFFVSRYGKDEHSTEVAESHYKVLRAWNMTKKVLKKFCA